MIEDREQLLDIGLSYIPAWSKTAQAIVAARTAYAAGEDWKVARERVLEVAPSPVAQYSPPNLGFQVIGWLYGENFGDALCKAVSCGYDTDCTGATLGSILGILAGWGGLPQKWTEPLGEAIATNESWSGLRHVSDGPNPVPTTLAELTDRVCSMAQQVLTAHGRLKEDGVVYVDPKDLMAGAEIHALWEASPLRLEYQRYGGSTITPGVDYTDTPTCIPDTNRSVLTTLTNPHMDAVYVDCRLYMPDGWQSPTQSQTVTLPPQSTRAVTWQIAVPGAGRVENMNTLLLSVQTQGYPAQPAVPIVLIGAHKYRYAGPFPDEGQSEHMPFEHIFEPEKVSGSLLTPYGRAGNWHDCYSPDNTLPFRDILAKGGVLYVQAYLWSPIARQVWMGSATNGPVKLWVNNELIVSLDGYRPLRPNYGGKAEHGYASVPLAQGWNEVLMKFVRSADAPAFDGHFLMSSADELHNGLPDIRWTCMLWDK